jgi:uncharacterized membrane protein affecting hemolysin expression
MSKKITYVKTSSLSKKFAQLAAAIMLIIVLASIWFNVSSQGESMLSENAQVLARNILLQTSHSAQRYIENDELPSLHHLTESALRSNYVYEMVIYDKYGVVLSKSDNAIETKVRFLSQLNEDITDYEPLPFVQEIRDETDRLLGFVRITVLTKRLQQAGSSFIETISQQILMIIALAVFCGFLLTKGLRPFSSNAYYVNE